MTRRMNAALLTAVALTSATLVAQVNIPEPTKVVAPAKVTTFLGDRYVVKIYSGDVVREGVYEVLAVDGDGVIRFGKMSADGKRVIKGKSFKLDRDVFNEHLINGYVSPVRASTHAVEVLEFVVQDAQRMYA